MAKTKVKARLLGRDDILRAVGTVYEEVEAFGGLTRVKGLNGQERDEFEASMLRPVKQVKGSKRRAGGMQVKLANVRAKLCSLSCVDDKGERLFTDADVAQLGAINAKDLDIVYEVACRLSGISDEDAEELAGN